MSLRLDLLFEDPRMILYLTSKGGKSLGLVFKCEDRQKQLLDAIVGMQDSLTPENVKTKTVDFLAVCPNVFKISSSGDKLIPVKSKSKSAG